MVQSRYFVVATLGRAMNERNDRRAERLKAALRDNLRRRKDQGRGRAEAPEPASDRELPDETEPPDDPLSDKTDL